MKELKWRFSALIFQKCSDPLIFEHLKKWKASSRHNPARLFPTSSSNRVLDVLLCLPSCMWNQVFACALFAGPIFQKALRAPHFFKKTKVKWRSRFSHVPFLLPIFSRSNRATMETETFFRRPQKSLYPKILHTFVPENLFKPGCTRSRKDTPPHYLMRMWLTWWCGWHNDWDDGMVAMMVRKLTIKIRIVRNSEVSWLNFLWLRSACSVRASARKSRACSIRSFFGDGMFVSVTLMIVHCNCSVLCDNMSWCEHGYMLYAALQHVVDSREINGYFPVWARGNGILCTPAWEFFGIQANGCTVAVSVRTTPKTERAKTVALRASVPEMLKVTTLLYWQSSANLSPNFCCNMSWCKHGDMCFSALQHVVMQICSLRTFRLSYSQLSGPPNVQKPVWCLATSLVVQYKTPILEEHHLYWTRQLISSNNQQGSAGQNACYACCCFQIKELSQCSSAIPKSKNSHNVRLYDSVRQADQDPQKHIQTSIATVAATGNTIQFWSKISSIFTCP